ncbi:M48 family peptidase [Dysgonomonas sp. 216]|uniref:M48 family metallopeptidase n=1 Tax=Dysgonomonas sp. 216 TaxID=2302934 RepID=UPI0013D361E8|nr:M48 family metallopeptidase [Dysgonomonas sp. 216]NDW19237.1 M48 family peptidase [Dysgonomonas sp. 216]
MLYYIIILIVVLDFGWTQYLAYRNRKLMTPIIPEKLKGIYDQEKYNCQQAYQKENSRFGIYTSLLSFIIILVVLSFGLFGWLDNYLRGYIESPMLLTLAFVGVVYVINEIVSLPFEYYSTFVIEEKFGFNKSSLKTFWFDQLKGLLLTIVLGGGILTLILWIFGNLGEYWWLYAWGAITVFSLVMTFLYSDIIVPLFNKQSPLEDGELRKAIEEFAKRADFSLKNIYVMDASKRSTKGNAYFTGFGSKKRIVLFDTLIKDLTTEEIVAVLAHEIGHYKKKHIVKQMIISVFYTGAMLFILSLFLNSQPLAEALGGSYTSFHLGIIAFSILFTPISLVLGLFTNVLSRKNEYEADTFAANFGLSDGLVGGLKKLSVDSLSNLNPDDLYVFFYYSHPTLLQRIKHLGA